MKPTLLLALSLLFISCESKIEPRLAMMTSLPSSHITFTMPESYETERTSDKNIPPKQRMIIKTASLTVEVDMYDSAVAALQKLVTLQNGFIVSSEISSTRANKKMGAVKLRVPAALFDQTIESITRLSSRIITTSIHGNDVTEEFYDVSSRLVSKKKIEVRYREILKAAKTVEDILAVEKHLGEIREEIESLEGRKNFLGDQSAFCTIRINLQEPKAYVEYEGKGFWSKVGDGFREGLTGFGDVLSTTISVLISSIPLVALLFLGIFVSRKFFKRYSIFHRKA